MKTARLWLGREPYGEKRHEFDKYVVMWKELVKARSGLIDFEEIPELEDIYHTSIRIRSDMKSLT